jgi:uncharacterized protein (TIRG00374 family)
MKSRWVKFGLRLLVSLLLITWALRGIDLQAVGASLRQVHLGWFAAALMLHVVGVLISACRWHLLLRAQGVGAPVTFLTSSYLVGFFFNNFLPGSVGGDVYRAWDTVRFSGDRTRPFAVILVERATGLLTLLFLASAVALTRVPSAGKRSTVWLVTLGVAAAAVVLFLVLRVAEQLPGRLRRVGEKVARFRAAIVLYRERKNLLVAALLLGLALQLNYVLHFYLIGLSLKLGLPFLIYLVVVPLVAVLLLLPVSINGVGVRENAYMFFFGALGITPARTVAFCWASLAALLFFGLVGGLVYAFRRLRVHDAPGPRFVPPHKRDTSTPRAGDGRAG